MKLYIKYMVSVQCELLVQEELERLGISFRVVNAGVVDLFDEITLSQRGQLKISLLTLGLKLHEAKKGALIEKIKFSILEMIDYSDGLPVVSNSIYLSEKLDHNYTYLANVFSEVNGFSIQQFIILSKIEKVKELLLVDEINLSEISYKLHYSSVAHLSGQFKKITGISPSAYKLIGNKKNSLMETV